MYSASVVDRATHFYNLDCHDTAPPTKVNTYLEVNFLSSKSPAMSASVNPSKTGFELSKHKYIFKLSLKYMKIHVTAF